MSRTLRKISTSGISHIMMRGINKQTVFEDDNDNEKFLETIGYYKSVSKYMILGYALMNNHVHLLLRETKESISTAIQRICDSFIFWYNRKYDRCGHLFQSRFKSETVETEASLLRVLRYIHQNPVKAGLSKSVQDYEWSSYHEFTNRPIIADTSYVLQMFSSDQEKAIAAFIEYTNEKNEDKYMDYIEKTRLTDNEAREHLAKLGLENTSEIQHLDINQRNDIIRKMKEIQGISIRQLSRVTGISKGIIERA